MTEFLKLTDQQFELASEHETMIAHNIMEIFSHYYEKNKTSNKWAIQPSFYMTALAKTLIMFSASDKRNQEDYKKILEMSEHLRKEFNRVMKLLMASFKAQCNQNKEKSK